MDAVRVASESGAYLIATLVMLDMAWWWLKHWRTSPPPRPKFAVPVFVLICAMTVMSALLVVSALVHGLTPSDAEFAEYRRWARPVSAATVLVSALALQWWRRRL